MIRHFIFNILEKIHILQNLYLKNKCFLNKKTYSMDEEDLEVKKFFKDEKKGFFVDVGSSHPIHRNNTMLLYKKGWRGINIDISDFSIKLFEYLRPEDLNINLAVSKKNGYVDMFFQKKLSQLSTIKKINSNNVFQGKVKTEKIVSKKLTEIIDNSKYNGKKIDFLDIDVEGADLDVLESLDFDRYSPELICVEVIKKKNEESEIFKFLKIKN